MPPIPKEVQDKLDAARRAVAEAIVAAQDAGLVETSIDPPPVLDILITGRATDARTLRNSSAKKPYGLSPEVFAAWFTGYNTPEFEKIDYVHDVRIVHPSQGLKDYFDRRAAMLRNEIDAVRKAKGQPAAPSRPRPSRPRPSRPRPSRPRPSGRDQEVAGRPPRPRRRSRRSKCRRGSPLLFLSESGRVPERRACRGSRDWPPLPDRMSLPASTPGADRDECAWSKAAATLPLLPLAYEAARRSGAAGILILPEGPMDWDLLRPR